MFSSIREELNKSQADNILINDQDEWDDEVEQDTIYNYHDSLKQE